MRQALIFDYQQEIAPEEKAKQREVIFQMLLSGPRKCNEFMRKGIAQYNARIYELRKKGHEIEYNKILKLFILHGKMAHQFDAPEVRYGGCVPQTHEK